MISHSGFSNTDANGITIKNLLSAFPAEQKAEFYRDVQSADYDAAHNYFRVTDMQMMKALIGKQSRHTFSYLQYEKKQEKTQTVHAERKIPLWMKRLKHSFLMKYIREWLWCVSPWGHRELSAWIREISPDILVYMVGESLYMDKLVMQVQHDLKKPLVLYNGESYRIIDIKKRRGLAQAYYRKCERLYKQLSACASLIIYNSEMLQRDFEAIYPRRGEAMVAYNSAQSLGKSYCPGDKMNITYFGNLGVGRGDSLLEVAEILRDINPELRLDIYGNAMPELAEKYSRCENIRYHGFVNAQQLRDIMDASDILLHVESFDAVIAPRLKYAFSTKIAQCLQAGRCFVSYAPAGSASSEYLKNSNGAILVSDIAKLRSVMRELIENPVLRTQWANRAAECGRKNHDLQETAQSVKRAIENIA